MSSTPLPATDPSAIEIEPAPTTVGGIVRRLGPGMIIAASIVGSGELIATTKTGAEAGFVLLWLILIGCVIKVFAQVEFGRYTITEGRSTIEAMNLVPGPRAAGVNWLVWYWLIMFVCSTAQLGGIVGGVGQAMAIWVPITGDLAAKLDGTATVAYTYDDVYWAAIVTVITSLALINGRYQLVQWIATILVAGFTLVTLFNVVALPYFNESLSWRDAIEGLKFKLPPARPGSTIGPLGTALATFGIIGVGAAELVAYPYWCLEKGYARFTGKRDNSAAWAERANGWLRVMRWDALCSMAIYTLATVAFYLLGAAVLHPLGLTPDGDHMIDTLAKMYEQVFHPWGGLVFLFGAFAVLYSTFFVASAGNARIAADALHVFGLVPDKDEVTLRWTKVFCGLFPLISLAIYLASKNPAKLVMISGLAQAIMLPMLGGAALYFRYVRCDQRITPGRLWDFFLWLSFGGLLVTGFWGVWSHVLPYLAM